MSFLPFVFSFLLILVLASSALFTSFQSTFLAKKIILAQNRAQLGVIDAQEKREIDKLRRHARAKDGTPKPLKESSSKTKPYRDPRRQRSRYNGSKLNLAILWEKSDPKLYEIVYESTIRLLELLYHDADFYREAHEKNLASHILNAILDQKGDSLLTLFPADPQLAKIYYKMLKGTNTGYPPLEEYFKIEKKKGEPPVKFRYASTPVLRALLGDDTAERIMAEERVSGTQRGKKGILSHEQLRDLLQKHPSPFLDMNDLSTVFSFTNKGKGEPQAFVEPESKVIATR